jgi:hypothetical protein
MENFPDFLNAAEKNVGSTIKLFSCLKENYRLETLHSERA